jgi:hypothetical protein
MATRKLVLIAALAAVVLPALIVAQHEHRATVVTRGGDRVEGNLDGIGNGTVYVRVNRDDQRKLPMGDVLLIDFVGGASGLPDTELSVAAKPEHLVVFRDSTSWTGQLVSTVGGDDSNEPHQILFRVGNEERRMNLDRVGRIYLGNYPHTSASTDGAQAVPAGSIRVPGNVAWTGTNIIVRRGQRLTFSVDGQIQLSDDPKDIAVSAGSPNGRKSPNAPIPGVLAGALIARVGNSEPFPIGNVTTPVTMPATGQLFLGINDDHVNDNSGEFVVQVQNGGASRRR